MKHPNALIICPFFPPNLGGVETHLEFLSSYLSQHGYRTTVLTYRPLTTKVDSYQTIEKKKNLEIHRFWWFGLNLFDRTTPYPILQFLYIVPGLLVQSFLYMTKHHQEIDVIHAHGFAAAFIVRILDFFFPGKRKVVSTHFIYKRLNKDSLFGRLFGWVFSDFDRVLLIGEKSGQELQAIGLDRRKMQVFHHWLNLQEFRPLDKAASRKKLGLPLSPKLIILFVGRIIKMKGVFELLKSAKNLPRSVYFVLLGDGLAMEELRLKSKGISNFLLMGKIPHQKLVDYFGACDFLILPSLAEEAQPMVVMEALSCGRPVITTNKGAVVEMYNKFVGRSISPSTAAIEKIVSNFLNFPGELEEMRRQARPFALKNFSERNARIITENYQ